VQTATEPVDQGDRRCGRHRQHAVADPVGVEVDRVAGDRQAAGGGQSQRQDDLADGAHEGRRRAGAQHREAGSHDRRGDRSASEQCGPLGHDRCARQGRGHGRVDARVGTAAHGQADSQRHAQRSGC
jgi:hypothetical protein